MATQASKDKNVCRLWASWNRARKFRPGEGRVGVLPRTLVPMLSSARAREERQIHVEFEGTRISEEQQGHSS